MDARCIFPFCVLPTRRRLQVQVCFWPNHTGTLAFAQSRSTLCHLTAGSSQSSQSLRLLTLTPAMRCTLQAYMSTRSLCFRYA